MCKTMKTYDILDKIIKIIEEIFNVYLCKVLHQGKLTAPVSKISGVKQEYIFSVCNGQTDEKMRDKGE